MLPISIKTYYLNISYFNEHPLEEAMFTELYDFAEEYGIDDLRPSNVAKVSESFLHDEHQAAKYAQNKRSGRWPLTSCDENCRKDAYCETFSNIHSDHVKCKPKKDGMDWLHTIFSTMTEPWMEKIQTP